MVSFAGGSRACSASIQTAPKGFVNALRTDRLVLLRRNESVYVVRRSSICQANYFGEQRRSQPAP